MTMQPLLRQQTSISLRLAMYALQASLEQAERSGIRVSIVVVDHSGQTIHSAHMDGAPAQCQAIARNKAITAAGFGFASGEWSERLRDCSEAVRLGLPLQANMALFGGGEPFRVDGQVIGAIGVSGAAEEDDGDCALAAARRVAELLGG